MADETIETLGIALESDSTGYGAGLDEAAAQTDSFISSVGAKFEGLGGIITGVGVAAGGALLGIGVAAWDMSSQAVDATNQFQAALGLTREEAEGLSDVALEIFGDNWGGSLEEVSASLVTIQQQMGAISDDEMQSIAAGAFAISDVFGVDVNEVIKTTNNLMERTGATSKEAQDAIAWMFQNGLNASDDALESLNEYSAQIESAGGTIEEFVSILSSGFGPGVLGTDKAGDAFKEFFIRIQDGSTLTSDSLTALGIDANAFLADLSSGAMTGMDSFGVVIEKINEIEDPIERNRVGVGLFGAAWEDLGPKAAASLNSTSVSLEDMEGSVDSLGAKYNTLGSMMTGVWRQVQVNVLKPIGDSLLSIANEFLPYVQDGFQMLGDLITGELSLGDFIANVGAWIAGAWPGIQAGLESILVGMIDWVGASAPVWIAALSQFAQGVIGWAADALPGLIANLASLAQAIVGWVADSLPGWIEALAQFASKAAGWVLDALPGLITNLGSVFTSMGQWVVDSLPGWGAKLAELGAKLWQWVIDMLPTLGTKLGEVTASLLRWAGDAIAAVVPKLLELAGKFISWIVVDVLPVLPEKLLELGSAILTAIGNYIVEVAPELLRLAERFYLWVTEDVLPKIPGVLGDLWESISGWITDTAKSAWDAVKSIGTQMVDGIIQGIKSMGNALFDALLSPVKSAVDGVTEWLGIKSPSRLMADDVGGPMMTGLIKGITDEMEPARSALRSSIGSLKDEITASMKPVMDGSLIADLAGRVGGGAIANPLQSAFDIFKKAPATAPMGQSLIDGIVAGMESRQNTFSAALTGLIDGAKQSAISFAGIHSPSDLFATEIGNPLVAGIIEGVIAGRSEAVMAIKDTLSDMLGAAAPMLPALNNPIGPMYNQPSATRGEFDSALADLTSRINGGGNKTLQIFTSQQKIDIPSEFQALGFGG